MKKIILFIVACFAGYAMAQDTITHYYPDSNYFYNYDWPSTVEPITGAFGVMNSVFGGHILSSKDSITVYGIAVCATIQKEAYMDIDDIEPDNPYGNPNYVYDRSLDSVFEYFSIYTTDSIPTIVGEPLKLHIRDTPISYYWDLGFDYYYSYLHQTLPVIFPTYELYFQEGVTLVDTFYLVATNYTHQPFYDTTTDQYYCYIRWPLDVYELASPQFNTILIGYYNHVGNIHGWWTNYHPWPWAYMVFPILTPKNDTVQGGDTVSSTTPTLLDRFVITRPNPASTSVQVVSSVGLSFIEVSDMNGREMFKAKVSGNDYSVNVSEWGKGIYIFTIQTPMGAVKKKVIVQ